MILNELALVPHLGHRQRKNLLNHRFDALDKNLKASIMHWADRANNLGGNSRRTPKIKESRGGVKSYTAAFMHTKSACYLYSSQGRKILSDV